MLGLAGEIGPFIRVFDFVVEFFAAVGVDCDGLGVVVGEEIVVIGRLSWHAYQYR